MPGSETVLEKTAVESREVLPNSLMPAGLLDGLSKEERRDLVAYLMHPVQVDDGPMTPRVVDLFFLTKILG